MLYYNINKKTLLVHWINYQVLIDHLLFNFILNSKKRSKSYLKVFLKIILSGVMYKFTKSFLIFFDIDLHINSRSSKYFFFKLLPVKVTWGNWWYPHCCGCGEVWWDCDCDVASPSSWSSTTPESSSDESLLFPSLVFALPCLLPSNHRSRPDLK